MRRIVVLLLLLAAPFPAQVSRGSGVMNVPTLQKHVPPGGNDVVVVYDGSASGKSQFAVVQGAGQGSSSALAVYPDFLSGFIFSVAVDGTVSTSGQTGHAYYNNPASTPRWITALAGVEGGANSGSNFQAVRYADGGGVLSVPLFITRSTGYVGVNNGNPLYQLDVAGTARISAGGTVPAWEKYALVKIANGVNGCANANGCWQVNGVLGPAATAGLTQDIALFQLLASGFVETIRMKTATACTGTATALTGLGTATNNVFYRLLTYDIQAAASATNFSDSIAGTGSTTTAAVNVVASLATTVQNVDQLANGCAVDYWVKWGVLP